MPWHYNRGVRTSRITQPDPAPTEEEREIIYLLACGEQPADLAVKYATTRKAVCTRLWRMRQLFEVRTTIELVALFVARAWVSIPAMPGAPICMRSGGEACPVAARLIQLEAPKTAPDSHAIRS